MKINYKYHILLNIILNITMKRGFKIGEMFFVSLNSNYFLLKQ